MEIVTDKKAIVSETGHIPDEFYEHEKEAAITLIALAIIRELYENELIRNEEYEYISAKYKTCL